MKKADCLGIDKNGIWQVLESKFNNIAEDFQAGETLFTLDNDSNVTNIYVCNYSPTTGQYKWGSL